LCGGNTPGAELEHVLGEHVPLGSAPRCAWRLWARCVLAPKVTLSALYPCDDRALVHRVRCLTFGGVIEPIAAFCAPCAAIPSGANGPFAYPGQEAPIGAETFHARADGFKLSLGVCMHHWRRPALRPAWSNMRGAAHFVRSVRLRRPRARVSCALAYFRRRDRAGISHFALRARPSPPAQMALEPAGTQSKVAPSQVHVGGRSLLQSNMGCAPIPGPPRLCPLLQAAS
jgi:hypothetical protein